MKIYPKHWCSHPVKKTVHIICIKKPKPVSRYNLKPKEIILEYLISLLKPDQIRTACIAYTNDACDFRLWRSCSHTCLYSATVVTSTDHIWQQNMCKFLLIFENYTTNLYISWHNHGQYCSTLHRRKRTGLDGEPEKFMRESDSVADEARVPACIIRRHILQNEHEWIAVGIRITLHTAESSLPDSTANTVA